MKRFIRRFFESLKAFTALFLNQFPHSGKDSEKWLIGGALGEHFDENSAALFKYIRKNHPDINIYWVVNKNAECIPEIKKYGKFIYRHTIKTGLTALNAKVIICTHSISADICRLSQKYFKKPLSVYIDHGIRGFKRHPKNSFDFDIITSSGCIEKKFKTKWEGTSGKNVHITGLPMQDTLLVKNKKYIKHNENRKILFMPTWRPWLVTRKNLFFSGRKQLVNSEYFKIILDLLKNRDLKQYLKEKNITLECLLHRNMHIFYNEFKHIFSNNHIKLADININVQDCLVSADLLITDYSSVCFDFMLLNKPVIFFQFDRDRYRKAVEPLIDYETDLFGPVTFTVNGLISEIRKTADNNFKYNYSKHQNIKDGFIKYSDSKNCERVLKVIQDKLMYK